MIYINVGELPKQFTNAQNKEYLLKLKNGEEEALQELINHNLKLVLYRINKRFYNFDYDKNDLFQIGAIGLAKAIKTYDVDKKRTLSTYAITCIDNEILMHIRKVKKDDKVESLQTVKVNKKDNDDITLEDTIKDESIDIGEDYERKEQLEELKEILGILNDREETVIKMYFGIDYDREYNCREIGEKLELSKSVISKIKNGALAKLKIEMQRKNLKTIYEYFNQFSKEEIDEMLKGLTAAELAIINLRYGEDLEHPVTSPDWTKVHYDNFYGNLVPKMRRLLAKKRKLQGEASKQEKEIKIENKIDVENKIEAKEEEIQKEDVINNQQQEISKEDYVKILKTVKTPLFNKMVGVLNPKEAMIVSLKLGFVDDKYFSTESISNFLGIEEDEVREITSRVLKDYKKQVVSRIDRAIDFATDKSVKVKEKTTPNL